MYLTAKILIFYVIFYAALAGFFAAIFAVFYQTLDVHQPKWKLNDGLIGSNPGLGFRPMPDESNVESTLIWFEAANIHNTKHWISALDEFLEGNCTTIVQVHINYNFNFMLVSRLHEATERAYRKQRSRLLI